MSAVLSLLGVAGLTRGVPPPNPFLDALEGSAIVETPLLTIQGSGFVIADEVESLFRTILNEDLDSARAMVCCVSALPEGTLVKGIKKLLVDALRDPTGAKVLNAWKRYVGLKPHDVSESDRVEFGRAADSFEDYCDHLFDEMVEYLSAKAASRRDDLDDLLRSWRDNGKYFAVCDGREETLIRESLLFEEIEPLYQVEWEKRKGNLDSIVRDPRFGLGEHLKVVEVDMASSQNYVEWLGMVKLAIRHADYYGLKFGSPGARAPIKKPIMKTEDTPRGMGFREEKTNLAAGAAGNYSKQCYTCRRYGHIAVNCPEGNNRPPSFPTLPMTAGVEGTERRRTQGGDRGCFGCGSRDHLVKECPEQARRALITLATSPRHGGEIPLATIESNTNKIIPGSGTNRLCAAGSSASDSGARLEGRSIPELPSVEMNMRVEQVDDQDHSLNERDRYLPGIPVRVHANGTTLGDLVGVVDSCSSVNFIGKRAMSSLLRDQQLAMEGEVPQILIRTIHGCQMNTAREIELSVSLRVDGSWGPPRTDRFLVFDEQTIPGDFDVLFSHTWIVSCGLEIKGREGKVVVTYASEREAFSRASQTGPEGLCFYAFPIDNSEVEESDDTPDYFEHREEVKGLRKISETTGPLSPMDLRQIEGYTVDEPAAIPIRECLIDPPIRLEGYPMNAEKSGALKTMLDRLEEDGIVDKVERGSGYYTSPGFLVKKGEGKYRLVVDNQALNSRLMPTPGALQASSKEWHENLRSGHTWYGVLDIKDAFFRKSVRVEDRKFLHVRFFGAGEYRFNRLPQGMSCSPSYWNALMESIKESIRRFLGESTEPRLASWKDLWRRVGLVIYVDDILITGTDADDVRRMMQLLIQVLGFLNLFVPEAKRQGPARKVICLGMQLSGGKVGPTDARVEEIRQMPRPSSKEQLRSVLGVLNFCRRSIRPVDGLEPLLRMAQKSVAFIWGEEQEKCWRDVVQGISNIGVDQFSLHDTEEIAKYRLFLATDASELGHGWAIHAIPIKDLPAEPKVSVRLQDYAEVMKTIDIGYTPFKGAELNYSTHDKEGMAMFQLLKRARGLVYLFRGATVISDNIITLSKLRRWGDNESGDTTRSKRWMRWIADLVDLLVCRKHGGRCVDHLDEDDPHELHGLVRLQHTSGKDFFLVDWLSRYFLRGRGLVDQACQTGDTQEHIVHLASQEAIPAVPFDVPLEVQRWHEDGTTKYCGVLVRDIWYFLRGGEHERSISSSAPKYRNRISRLSSRFTINEFLRLIYLGGQESLIAVPDVPLGDRPLRECLIWLVHEGTQLSAHRGMTSTAGTLRKSVWWPGLDLSVATYIKGCRGCTIAKADHRRAVGTPSPRLLSHPNQLLVVDWAGPFPGREGDQARYVLVMVDAFTGFCHLRGAASKEASSAVDGVLEWAASYGMPESWTHDSDRAFTSEFMQRMIERFGMVECSGGLTYTPRANGSAERYVRILKECITAFAPTSGTPTGWSALLKAVQYCQNSGAYRAYGITPFELMLGRKPRGMLETIFGAGSMGPESSDRAEYARSLEDTLRMLHEYWASRQQEDRLVLADMDYVMHGPAEIRPGQWCIRIAYISNQRKVFPGEYEVVGKVAGSTNTYEVRRRDSTSTERVVGYQLIPIEMRIQTARPFFEEDPQTTVREAAASAARAKQRLRGSPAGTMVASAYDGKLYIGELTSPFLTGRVVEVLFYVPLGHDTQGCGRFRRPRGQESLKNLEIVDVDTIEYVDVNGEWCGDVFTVTSGQFS